MTALNRIIEQLEYTFKEYTPDEISEVLLTAPGPIVKLSLADMERLLEAKRTPALAPDALDPQRCGACGWPLEKDALTGCVRGNCCQRPLPERMYDGLRYLTEQQALRTPEQP